MQEPRPEKVAVVGEVGERLAAAGATIFTEYRGLTVAQLAELRRALEAAGGHYKVYKNTLVRRALSERGLTQLEGFLTGPTAIAFVDADVVGVARALRDFARLFPALVVKGGMLGDHLLGPADAAALADIPPRDVLLARLAGDLAAPLAQLAGLLQALPRNLLYGLRALADRQEAATGDGAQARAAAEIDEPPPPTTTTTTQGD